MARTGESSQRLDENPETDLGSAATQFDNRAGKRCSQLLHEFGAANGALHSGSVEWVIEHGVPSDAIWCSQNARIGVGPIETAGQHFEFNPDGQPAIVLACCWLSERTVWQEPLETLVDLVAWHPAEPDRWFLRRGTAAILNPEAIERAVFLEEPLFLWESPLQWLQCGMKGSVVLDTRADVAFWLGGVRQIYCQSRRLAERIDRALHAAPKRKTEILYAQPSRVKA